MIYQVLKNTFFALGIGFVAVIICGWLETEYLMTFFSANLITILVALLAVNAATMGIVLTKIRDLIDGQDGGAGCFSETRRQMLLSVKEQVGLIILAILILSIDQSPIVSSISNVNLLIDAVVTAIFAYALMVLYDTAKGVLIIVDYDAKDAER